MKAAGEHAGGQQNCPLSLISLREREWLYLSVQISPTAAVLDERQVFFFTWQSTLP
jgi:hypothetical protein